MLFTVTIATLGKENKEAIEETWNLVSMLNMILVDMLYNIAWIGLRY